MTFPLEYQKVTRLELRKLVVRFIERHYEIMDEASHGFFWNFSPVEEGVPTSYDRLPDFLKATLYHVHAQTTPTPGQVLALARSEMPSDELLAQLTAHAESLDLLVQLELYLDGGMQKLVLHDSTALWSFLERAYPIVDTEQFSNEWKRTMRPK